MFLHSSLSCASVLSILRSFSSVSFVGIFKAFLFGLEGFDLSFLYVAWFLRSWLSVVGSDVGGRPLYLGPLFWKYSVIAVCAGMFSSRLSTCPNNFHLCCTSLWLIGLVRHRSYKSSLLIFSGH